MVKDRFREEIKLNHKGLYQKFYEGKGFYNFSKRNRSVSPRKKKAKEDLKRNDYLRDNNCKLKKVHVDP